MLWFFVILIQEVLNMSRRISTIELSSLERMELEEGFRNGESHCFRMRCHAILLKSQGMSNEAVGELTEMSAISVYSWLKRYRSEGFKGLYTKPGRGRKPIMDCSDEEAVKAAIAEDRQSVSKARQAWQDATGKEASDITFKRFLSALVQDISV